MYPLSRRGICGYSCW